MNFFCTFRVHMENFLQKILEFDFDIFYRNLGKENYFVAYIKKIFLERLSVI